MFLSSLFISVYVARILGPEAKGTYYLLVQLVAIIVLCGMFGIDNSAIYFLGKNRMPKAELSANILFLTLLSSIVLLVLTLSFRNLLVNSVLKGVPAGHLMVMSFAVPFFLFNQIFLSLILGMNRIIMYNVSQMLCYFFLFFNFIIFVVISKLGLYGAYLGYIFTYLLMDCIYVFLLIRKAELRINWDHIKPILDYAARGFLGSIALLLIFKIDSFILNVFSDIRQVGFYSIAVSVAELILFVPLAIGTVLFPKLTSQEAARLNFSAARVIRTIFLFLVLLGLFFLIFGKQLIMLVYGKVYLPSVIPMYILLPGFIFVSLYYLFFSYFNAIGKPEIITFIAVITLVVKLILSLLIIPRWGISGAALASSISYFLCGVMFFTAFMVNSGKSWKEVLIINNGDIKYIRDLFSSGFGLGGA